MSDPKPTLQTFLSNNESTDSNTNTNTNTNTDQNSDNGGFKGQAHEVNVERSNLIASPSDRLKDSGVSTKSMVGMPMQKLVQSRSYGKTYLTPFDKESSSALIPDIEVKQDTIVTSGSKKMQLPTEKAVIAESLDYVDSYYASVSKFEIDTLFLKSMEGLEKLGGVKSFSKAKDGSWTVHGELDETYDNISFVMHFFVSSEKSKKEFKSMVELTRVFGDGFGFDSFFNEFDAFLDDNGLVEKPHNSNESMEFPAFSVRSSGCPMFDDSGFDDGDEEEECDFDFDFDDI